MYAERHPRQRHQQWERSNDRDVDSSRCTKHSVYDETGETQIISPQVKIAATGYQPVTYELRLIPGQNYKLVAWADFVNEGDTADLHYNTADLRNIVLIDDLSAQMNDESRDAYFGTKDLTAGDSFNETLTLKRPFAKTARRHHRLGLREPPHARQLQGNLL